MKRLFCAVAALALVFAAQPGHAASVNAPLSVTVGPPLALVLTPPSATEFCTVAGGTLVSTASTTGGDSNAVTFSMTGNTTDFVIDSSTGKVTVVTGGIASGSCGKTFTNTVTANQP